MKEIKIIFNKTEIYDEVSLNSAYAGAKNATGEDIYERVATVDADRELLSRFLTEMYGKVSERLREFIVESEEREDEILVTLEISGAYDDSLTPSVRSDLFGAMAKGVASMWFRFTSPSRSAEWLAESDSLLSRAYSKLCYRKKPLRK